jgi:hypothetical protein
MLVQLVLQVQAPQVQQDLKELLEMLAQRAQQE